MYQRAENLGDDWRGRIAWAFDRFVSRDVTDSGRRRRQARLFGSILAVTIVLVVLSVPLAVSDPSYLALPFITGAIGCALSALLSASGREGLCAVLTGAFALTFVTLILGQESDAAGVAFLILAVPVVEGWWALRRPLLTGFAAALAAGAACAALYMGWIASSGSLWSIIASTMLVLWIGSLFLRLPLRRTEKDAEAMSEAALLSHELVEGLPGAMVVFAPDGEMTAASAGIERVLGLPAPLLLGACFFERIHVGDRVVWLNALADARDGQSARALLRMRPALSGDVTFADMSIRLSPQRDGRIIGFLEHDPESASRAAELERLREETSALASARNRFLATVSHELRTPLNAIIGFADMLSSEDLPVQSLERQREYAELISRSGGHLLKVVNAILDISKMEAGAYTVQREPFDPVEALDMPMSIAAQQAAAEGVTVSRQLADDLPPLNADRRSIQQILINLLSNAVKFTPAGGSVVVEMSDDGRNFQIAVSDTGIGIAEDDLPRLGQPFMQFGDNSLAREHEGTGLGLSLVRGLVELQGGHMRIESRKGIGTDVYVTIPNLGTQAPVSLPPKTKANESTVEPNHDIDQRRRA